MPARSDVPEGRFVIGREPLPEVNAPLPQTRPVETYLLSPLCHQAVPTTAARGGRTALPPPVDTGNPERRGAESVHGR